MQFYFKAQSQHGHSMLQLAVELARIRSFFGDAPYVAAFLLLLDWSSRRVHVKLEFRV